MTLAYDYPLLEVFMSLLGFFLFFAFWIALFYVIVDIFRSKDLRGIAKAAWMFFVIFLPIIGVVMYLIVRGNSMSERQIDRGAQRDVAYQNYAERYVI